MCFFERLLCWQPTQCSMAQQLQSLLKEEIEKYLSSAQLELISAKSIRLVREQRLFLAFKCSRTLTTFLAASGAQIWAKLVFV